MKFNDSFWSVMSNFTPPKEFTHGHLVVFKPQTSQDFFSFINILQHSKSSTVLTYLLSSKCRHRYIYIYICTFTPFYTLSTRVQYIHLLMLSYAKSSLGLNRSTYYTLHSLQIHILGKWQGAQTFDESRDGPDGGHFELPHIPD